MVERQIIASNTNDLSLTHIFYIRISHDLLQKYISAYIIAHRCRHFCFIYMLKLKRVLL